MSSFFQPRFEVLPPAQIQLWKELAPAKKLGFVLYGGTALALRLGHRVSIDFDFFTEKYLVKNELLAAFPFLKNATVIQEELNTLSALVPSLDTDPTSVKISFFGNIGFGRVSAPQYSEDRVIQVASLDDLMATKLKVILQRAEAKDYVDIAAMLTAGVSLAKGLASARAIFGPNFQPSESLKALTYFEDGDLMKLTPSQKELLIQSSSAVSDLPVVHIQSHELFEN